MKLETTSLWNVGLVLRPCFEKGVKGKVQTLKYLKFLIYAIKPRDVDSSHP